MNIIKRWDLSVVVGEYIRDGRTKKRYATVGSLCETDTGPVIFLNRHFNPAGVPSQDRHPGSILISCYEQDNERERNEQF